MPIPVAAWTDNNPVTAKSLNLCMYTSDGTADNPTGVAFHAYRPLLFESYGTAITIHTNTGGSQSSLAGTVTVSSVIYDSAGFTGQFTDQPGSTGYYQFTPAVNGSAGDGITAGGWTLLAHFAAVTHKSTQTSVSADLLGTGKSPVSGTRQAPSNSLDSTAFFLDLVSAVPGITWSPAVTVSDSGSNSTTLVANTTDSSGETSRFLSVWAAVSATTSGEAVFAQGGTFPFTAPAGVTSIVTQATGSGGGAGAGNAGVSTYGGGGGGGGEVSLGTVSVTALNNYTVTVGSGGTPGNPGNISQFAGDTGNVTAHGGSAGGSASASADGAGGAGGTGASGTHHNGGAGAAGVTNKYGGGGGSSAGPAAAGTTATGPAGAGAPSGGGPGGTGGVETVTIVQQGHFSSTGGNNLTVKMPAPFQAGNTVIALVYYQGEGPNSSTAPADPTVTLSDGTPLTNQISADVGSRVSLNNGLYDIYGITGGQTGLILQGQGTGNDVKAFLVQVFEVSGLGPSPRLDVSTSHTQGPSNPDNFYTSHSVGTNFAPELWVAMAGAQYTSPFSVYDPPGSQGWTGQSARYVNNGGIYAALKTAYQTVTKTGTMLFSGTYSRGVSKGALAVAYQPMPVTTGSAPIIGPGGGGGGGYGAPGGTPNTGGAGSDGQVILTWTAPSGSGYGTPALPAPYSTWSDATTVGTSSMVAVNLNGPAGPGGVLNFLSNAPVFRISQSAATSISTATITQVPFTGLTPTVDNYSGWSSGTYTVQRDGLYLLHGLVAFANASGGSRAALVTVNGTSYWGPVAPAAPVGTINVAKTAILGLHAGDTVQLSCYQTKGSTLALDTGNQTRFLLTWLCEIGVPAGTWSPPDTTFRWQSGTKPTADGGNLTGLFQAHLGNDLGFLVNRPYLTAYQNLSQANLTAAVFSTVTLDSVQGLIHNGDNGDNYAGWTSGASNLYTAQVAGWYLAVCEFFTGALSASSDTVTAALLPSTSGGVTPSQTPDWFQQQTATTNVSLGGGAAGIGLYYLAVGETLTPQIMAAGFGGNYSTLAGTSAGAHFAPALGLVWISELCADFRGVVLGQRLRAVVLATRAPAAVMAMTGVWVVITVVVLTAADRPRGLPDAPASWHEPACDKPYKEHNAADQDALDHRTSPFDGRSNLIATARRSQPAMTVPSCSRRSFGSHQVGGPSITCAHKVPKRVCTRRVRFRWPGSQPVESGALESAAATSASVNGPACGWRYRVTVCTPPGTRRLITRVIPSSLSM